MMKAITDAQWCQYMRDGYLRLGHTLSATELAALQERIDNIMLGRADIDYDGLLMQLDSVTGKYGDVGEQSRGHKGATLDYRKIEYLEHDPLFLEFMRKPIFREICAEVYGASTSITAFRAMFMNKPAGKGTILPWHQDGGDIWGLDRDPLVTIWTALDPATVSNGCVQIIPGSHRLGLLSAFGHTVTEEQIATHCLAEKIVYLQAEPGESILLHNWLLHTSDVNRSDRPRRAFSVCYMDGRTVGKNAEKFGPIFGSFEKPLGIKGSEHAIAEK